MQKSTFFLFVFVFSFFIREAVFAQNISSPELQRGKSQYELGNFEAAHEIFRRARETEVRAEVRQKLLAMNVRSLHALGRTTESYQEFFMLCRMDPFSAEFDCIPLVWFSDSFFSSVGMTPDEQLASQWIHPKTNPSGVENPAASLLACSILLSSAQPQTRSKAMEQLQQLTFYAPDEGTTSSEKKTTESTVRRQIAILAQTQLWRTKIVTLKDEKELAVWEPLLESLPKQLRSGPCFLLGTAYAKLENHEKAILFWMKNPILYSDDRSVAAKSLLESAKTLRQLERFKKAQALLEEIVRDYPEQKIIVENAAAMLREQK